MRCRAFFVLVLVLVLVTSRFAQAGATTPTLVLSSGAGSPADIEGIRRATFDAVYDYANAVQADYDLELIVFQGERFARYPVSGTVRVGSSAALADGLAASDLPALDAASAPAPDTVRVVGIGPTEVSVTLPATFLPAPTTAALVATVDEGTVLSNPLVFVLP